MCAGGDAAGQNSCQEARILRTARAPARRRPALLQHKDRWPKEHLQAEAVKPERAAIRHDAKLRRLTSRTEATVHPPLPQDPDFWRVIKDPRLNVSRDAGQVKGTDAPLSNHAPRRRGSNKVG